VFEWPAPSRAMRLRRGYLLLASDCISSACQAFSDPHELECEQCLLQPEERSDSALDHLAAARAAVLPDLAADPPPPSPRADAAAEAFDGGLGRALLAPPSEITHEARPWLALVCCTLTLV